MLHELDAQASAKAVKIARTSLAYAPCHFVAYTQMAKFDKPG